MAEKRTIELEIQDNTKSLKAQYKEAVIELQKVSAAYGETSAEAIQAAKAAAQLKDQIQFTNDLVGSFNPDAKFNALSKSFGGVLDGFQAVEGGLALIGVEGESVQKAMLKVQSAMALSQGIQGLMEAKDSFKQLGSVASDAFKGMKGAMLASGIGLFIVALGTAVAYWDDIKAAVSGVSKEQAKAFKQQELSAELAQKKVKSFESEAKLLKLQGKSEQEINIIRAKRLNNGVAEQEAYIKAMKSRQKIEVDAAKRNAKIAESVVKFFMDSIFMVPKYIAKMTDLLLIPINKAITFMGGKAIPTLTAGMDELENIAAKKIANFIFDPEGVKSEGDKAIAEANNVLQDLKDQAIDNELAMREALQGSQNNANQTKAENERKFNENLQSYYDKLEADRQAKITDAREKEIQELANHYDELYAAADKAGQDTNELQKQHAIQIGLINKKYDEIDLQAKREKEAKAWELEKTNRQLQIDGMKEGKAKELEIIDLAYDSELMALKNNLDAKTISEENYQKQKALIEEKYGKQIDDTNAKFDKQDQERRQAAIQRNADFAKQGLTIISDLTELFGKKGEKQARKAFNIKKAASISTALIDTFLSARAAYLSQFTPVPDPSSPVRGGIAAGLAVASGLVGVAKIASQKFEGGGSSSGGGGGSEGGGGGMSGGSQAPSFNVVGNNGLNQLAQLQQQPTQAYVVSGQVTTAQSLDRNRIQNATL
jgi:hypothetical protein